MTQLLKPEVLSPAGDFERLIAAVNYGADAVYLGGTEFGMRSAPQNFTSDSLALAVEFAHQKGVKVYLTCNTLPTNEEIDRFPAFLQSAVCAGVDAVIVSDIGVLSLIKQYAPTLEVHISTQAGIVNHVTANTFYNMGAKRVVLARELSLDDIATLRAKTPKELDIEVFVHGAMCVSFSGRCLLSNYFVGRDANRGACAQPCRWNYYLMEERRPGEYYKIEETEQGTYILNAKDMCLIEHIDKLIAAGATSLKIEGRAKSAYYVSVITNAYRMAVDGYLQNPTNYQTPEWLIEEVQKVSHRQYTTGFLFGRPDSGQYYENGGYIRNFDVIGMVEDCRDGYLHITQRNKFLKGDRVELLRPGQRAVDFVIESIYDDTDTEVEFAPHPMQPLKIPFNGFAQPGSILRKNLNM